MFFEKEPRCPHCMQKHSEPRRGSSYGKKESEGIWAELNMICCVAEMGTEGSVRELWRGKVRGL